MNNLAGRVGLLAVALLLSGTAVTKDSKETDAALKQLNKTTKKIGGIVAEVDYAEIIGKIPKGGKGKFYVHYDGMVRVDVEADSRRTILFIPPYFYDYREADETVDIYDTITNPDILGQYAVLGFVPTGTAMKKRFHVDLTPDRSDSGTLHFLLTPKNKDAARRISRIELWVDPASGLPVRHQITHALADTKLTIEYLDIQRDDDLPLSLFQPRWPKGTETVRH